MHKDLFSSVASNHSFRLDTAHVSNRSMHKDSLFLYFSSQQSQFQVLTMELFVGIGENPGFNAQECTNKTLTTSPFDNTCQVDEVSPEVEAGVVVGLRCLQP
jgi:hypothetical protein